MTDTGWKICTSGYNYDDGGDQAWTNPSYITADDASYANCTPAATKETQGLRGATYGMNIPTGSTIDGIEVRFQIHLASAGTASLDVNVGKNDTTMGTVKTADISLTTSPTNYDWGSASDKWGLSWTVAEINASTFLSHLHGNDVETYNVDAAWVRITYTLPPVSMIYPVKRGIVF